MKIIASIPIEKTFPSPGTVSSRSGRRECEVRVIMRRACGDGAASNRYYYTALIVPPSDAVIEPYSMERNGWYRVNVVRTLNPNWKPPVFQPGVHVMDVALE